MLNWSGLSIHDRAAELRLQIAGEQRLKLLKGQHKCLT